MKFLRNLCGQSLIFSITTASSFESNPINFFEDNEEVINAVKIFQENMDNASSVHFDDLTRKARTFPCLPYKQVEIDCFPFDFEMWKLSNLSTCAMITRESLVFLANLQPDIL